MKWSIKLNLSAQQALEFYDFDKWSSSNYQIVTEINIFCSIWLTTVHEDQINELFVQSSWRHNSKETKSNSVTPQREDMEDPEPANGTKLKCFISHAPESFQPSSDTSADWLSPSIHFVLEFCEWQLSRNSDYILKFI